VIFGWGPDYVGDTPVTNDIKFKCNLLVDFIYFYNIVPLHGDEHVIPSKTDSSKVVMVFCDPMNATTLSKYNCDQTMQTMAVFIDTAGKCHKLSGPDMNNNAQYQIDNVETNNGLVINYNGADQGYGFTLDMKCLGED